MTVLSPSSCAAQPCLVRQMRHRPSMCTPLISSGDDAFSSFAKHSGLTNILYSLQNTCSVTREIEKEGEANAAPFEVE